MSCFVSFWALPIFFYNFIKNKISQCLNGVYVEGSSEVWQWSRLSCIHFSEKQITWCCYRVYVKGNRSPKKLHRIQNAEGSMISALSWGPPFLEPKNITNQQFYKDFFVQKKEVVFCFFPGYPDFLVSTFLKTTYHNAGTGSMLRGVQRYDNDPEFLVYTVLKNNNMVLLQGLC